jgi:ABC-type phosphate transport system substrate-binding protein
MRVSRVVFRCCCLTAILLGPSVYAADEFKIIAHPSVPFTAVSRDELSSLFLKKTTTYQNWGSAQKVTVFDLAPAVAAREHFTTTVHGRRVSAVKSFWQQQIFSGRGTPPVELGTDSEVVAKVAQTPGAVGYVGADAVLPPGVVQIRLSN